MNEGGISRIWQDGRQGATESAAVASVQFTDIFVDAHVSVRSHEGFYFRRRTWSLFNLTTWDIDFDRADVDIALKPANSKHLVLIAILRGSLRVRRSEGEYDLVAGCAIAFNSVSQSGTVLLQSHDLRSIIFRIPYTCLEEFLESEMGHSIPTNSLTFPVPPFEINHDSGMLFGYLQWSVSSSSGGEAMLADKSLRALIHHYKFVLGLLFSGINSNYQSRYIREKNVGIALSCVARAEDFIRANAESDLTASAVAKRIGVAERTLREGFQRCRSYSISDYLRIQRLDLAKEMLEKPTRKNMTVTDVALGCGFLHLSRFASQYKRQFGENPSETLKRAMIS